MTQTNIFDVAKYILKKLGTINVWKLQKLCYFAQAYNLALTDRPLFAEEFEAWSNGAVCCELENILKEKLIVNQNDIKNNLNQLTNEEKRIVNKVIKQYGNKETYELRILCCSSEPYKLAEKNGGMITKENIKEYYKKYFKVYPLE